MGPTGLHGETSQSGQRTECLRLLAAPGCPKTPSLRRALEVPARTPSATRPPIDEMATTAFRRGLRCRRRTSPFSAPEMAIFRRVFSKISVEFSTNRKLASQLRLSYCIGTYLHISIYVIRSSSIRQGQYPELTGGFPKSLLVAL
eukprot:scaffold1906_cov106-Isochrysis_galbana.AAC.13